MARYCPPCETPFSSIKNAEEHEHSPAHKKRVDQLLREHEISESFKESRPAPEKNEGPEAHDDYMIAVDKNQYFCKLCKANCAGRIPAFNHIQGKQHCQKLKQFQFSPEMASLGSLSASGEFSSTDGERGISLAVSTAISRDLDYNRVTGHFTCKICKIRMSGQTPARDHLKGKAHLKKLRIAKEMGYITDDISDDISDSFRSLSISGSHPTNALPTVSARGDISVPVMDCQADTKVPVPSDNISQSGNDDAAEHSVSPTSGAVGGNQLGEDGMYQTTATGDKPEDVIKKHGGDLVFDGTMYKCSVCSVSLNSEKTIGQHFIGKAHLKKKRESTGVDERGDQLPEDVKHVPGTGKFRCTVCNVDMTGAGPLAEHLRGKAHRKNKQVTEGYSLPAYLPGNIVTGTPNMLMQHGNVGQQSTTKMNTGGYPVGTSTDGNVIAGNTVSGNGVETQSPWNTSYPSELLASGGNNMVKPTGQEFAQTTTVSAADPALPSPPITRPPPGFEGVPAIINGRANSMPDFLSHQNITSETQSSMMHPFWSMPAEDRNAPGESPWNANRMDSSARLAPIGTPSQIAPTKGSQPQEQSQDVLRTEFSFNSRTMKFLCNTCRIDVTGSESARAHLQGTKHAKKAKALQFQMYHMPPPITTASPINTRPHLPSMTALDQPFPSAPHQPPNADPANQFDSNSGVLARRERMLSSSFGISLVTGAGSSNHDSNANTLGSLRWQGVKEHDSTVTQYENDGPRFLQGVSMCRYNNQY